MKYVVRPEDVEPYGPANHSGTRNFRLVGAQVNGARQMEVVLGEIQRNEGAAAHMHPGLEQALYMLEGEAVVEIGAETHRVRAGDTVFFPADVFHTFKATSERARVLVVYAPPYGESPDKAITKK